MGSIDLIVESDVAAGLDLTMGELRDLMKIYQSAPVSVRSLGGVSLIPWDDYLRIRDHVRQAMARDRRPAATVTDIGTRAAVTFSDTDTDKAIARATMAERTLAQKRATGRKADPYPIDPQTEVEELARLRKPDLQVMAVELGLPEAASLYQRKKIAERIVDEKVRRHALPPPPPEVIDFESLIISARKELVGLASELGLIDSSTPASRSAIARITKRELAQRIVLERVRQWYDNQEGSRFSHVH